MTKATPRVIAEYWLEEAAKAMCENPNGPSKVCCCTNEEVATITAALKTWEEQQKADAVDPDAGASTE
jgi:hypothetical protein